MFEITSYGITINCAPVWVTPVGNFITESRDRGSYSYRWYSRKTWIKFEEIVVVAIGTHYCTDNFQLPRNWISTFLIIFYKDKNNIIISTNLMFVYFMEKPVSKLHVKCLLASLIKQTNVSNVFLNYYMNISLFYTVKNKALHLRLFCGIIKI